MSAARVGLALALASAAGCTKSVAATEIIVVFDAEPGLRRDVDVLHVSVTGGTGRERSTRADRFDQDFAGGAGGIRWPRRVTVVPLDDDESRIFEIVGEAFDGNMQVGLTRAITGFVPKRTRYVSLVFTEGCRGHDCNDDSTCRTNACVDANLEVAQLLQDAPATVVPDAGDDADAATDPGQDPADAAAGPVEDPTADAATDARSDVPECVEGEPECPCLPGGGCGAGLVCVADVCMPDDCGPGPCGFDAGTGSGASPDGGAGGCTNTAVDGTNTDPNWQDCFFDRNSGFADDGCRYHVDCYDGTLPASDPDCTVTDMCKTVCRPLTPPNCDCFGCCGGTVTREGSSSPCTPDDDCMGTCGL